MFWLQCQRKVKQIDNASTRSNQEQTLSKNIQTSLALKIQNGSLDFRKMQTAYLKKLKLRGNRNPGLFATENIDLIEENWELGFSDQQLELIESSEAIISQREHEINEISKSINSLVTIFKNMQSLVIDQGTLLDRIDYNVEQMSVNVRSAAKVLEQLTNTIIKLKILSNNV
ncbi:13270_t:CDS:2 [Entrophospora sp. SA101]|nr:13270_t:CDS:2 [Entrophospora sp. SA101]